MASTNADGSTPTNSPGWFDSLLGSLGNAAKVGQGWKELIDPVKAAQQPSFVMGTSTPLPVVQSPAGTPGGQSPLAGLGSNALLYVAGGLLVLLLVVLMGRR